MPASHETFTKIKRFLTEDRPPKPDTTGPDRKVFAKGWNFIKIFTFFVIGCVVGTYYEEISWFVRFGERVSRKGIFYGPFSPIYGLGFAIFTIFLGRRAEERSWLKTWAWSALIGGSTEYMTSVIAEKIFGSTIWDYHELFLNIDGRTTIPFMLFWGVGGVVLVKVLYPPISRLIEKIPPAVGRAAYTVAIVLMVLDLILSYGAMGRRAMRDAGEPPKTFVGEFFDRVYPDEYIQKMIPAMIVTENGQQGP